MKTHTLCMAICAGLCLHGASSVAVAAPSTQSAASTLGSLSAVPAEPTLPKAAWSVGAEMHAATANHFRGQQWSQGQPSIGLSANIKHETGFKGRFAADSVTLTRLRTGPGHENNQIHNVFSLGYEQDLSKGASADVRADLTVGMSVDHHAFTGQGHINEMSFTEISGFAQWEGARFSLSRTIEGANVRLPGFGNGDMYGEIGYTHDAGPFSFGADLGYAWYQDRHADAENGLAVSRVRVGYAHDSHLRFDLSHDFNLGRDALDDKRSGNNKTIMKVTYAFF